MTAISPRLVGLRVLSTSGVTPRSCFVPGLRALARIVAGHAQFLAFENLDMFTGRDVRLARPDTDRRYTLSGAKGGGANLAVHHLDNHSERRDLSSPATIRAALEEHFLIDLSGLPDLDTALTRLF